MERPGLDPARRLTHDEVVALVGDLDEGFIARIMETNATFSDIEQALSLLGMTDDPPMRSLTSAAEAVYDILKAAPALIPTEER